MERQEDFCETCQINDRAIILRCRRYQNWNERRDPPCFTRSSLEQPGGRIVTHDGIPGSYDPAHGRNYLRFFL